jgi:hypothetical protein
VNDAPNAAFEKAIRATHGADPELERRIHVHEYFQGETVWEGEVLVFKLSGHPTADRCYAWEVDGLVTAVLHEGPVDSPQAAVGSGCPQLEVDGVAELPEVGGVVEVHGGRSPGGG